MGEFELVILSGSLLSAAFFGLAGWEGGERAMEGDEGKEGNRTPASCLGSWQPRVVVHNQDQDRIIITVVCCYY